MRWKTLLVLVLVILVSGCAQQQPKQETFVESDDALDIAFLVGQPPDKIFSSDEFDIAVQLTNKGGMIIKPNNVTLVLRDGRFLYGGAQLTKKTATKMNNETLGAIERAPSGEFLPGGTETLAWEGVAYNSVRLISEEIGVPIAADACYKYETTATAKLCVKIDSSASCSDDGAKTVENSGAPVKISELTELKSQKTANGAEVAFKFKLEKTGDDKYKIYKYDLGATQCAGTSADDLNRISINTVKFQNNYAPQCYREAAIDSDSGESDYINCRLNVSGAATSFEDSVTIKFAYLVKQSANKNVQIIPI